MKHNAPCHSLAHRYARAVFELSVEESSLDETLSNLERFDAVMRKDLQLSGIIADAEVPLAKKNAIINDLSAVIRLPKLARHTILFLLDRDRMELLADIIQSFRGMVEKAKHLKHVQVTVADESMADDFRRRIEKMLSGILGGHIKCEMAVDPTLIGGALLRINDCLLDTSVAGRLSKMREELL